MGASENVQKGVQDELSLGYHYDAQDPRAH